MSNKQQSAVDFLIEELKEMGFNHLDLATEIIDEAKEIELQNIRSAFVGCWIINVPHKTKCKVTFDEWYNKFKTDNNE